MSWKREGDRNCLWFTFIFFFINPSLVLLRGVRSPTSDVLQLGYSVVITLLQFDLSLATVFLLQDSSKREVRRFDKREVRHPVLLFHVLKKGVGDRNFLWCFFFTNPSLVLLRGLRSPTSVVLQLGYSVVIALLRSDFSLATVLQFPDRRGLFGNYQHENKGRDRPARTPMWRLWSRRIITFKLYFCTYKRISISSLQTLQHR